MVAAVSLHCNVPGRLRAGCVGSLKPGEGTTVG